MSAQEAGLGEVIPLSVNGHRPRQLQWRSLEAVEMRSIEWIDRPLFQRAAFHLIAGKKGSGKGTYTAGLAARISRGELFTSPKNVLLVSSEDSAAIDTKPRVVAAGGDPARIFDVISDFRLPRDVAALKNAALAIGDIGLIVIDPIGNHLGGGDTDKEGPVRDAIAPLNDLADELDCLLLGVRHLSKDTSRGALGSVLGSTAWVDVPRAVLAVAADDEEELVFHVQVVAGNRSARGHGRSFRIELADVGLKEPVTRAVEIGDSSKDVESLLTDAGKNDARRIKRDDARKTILRLLGEGPKPLEQIKAACAAECEASGDTTWRAANELKAEGKIKTRNSGPGTPWLWHLTAA